MILDSLRALAETFFSGPTFGTTITMSTPDGITKKTSEKAKPRATILWLEFNANWANPSKLSTDDGIRVFLLYRRSHVKIALIKTIARKVMVRLSYFVANPRHCLT